MEEVAVDIELEKKTPVPTEQKYWSRLNWSGGYVAWDLVRFGVPADGNCFFHALCNAFFSSYHRQKIHGEHFTRAQIVTNLRRDLSLILGEVNPEDPQKRTYYQCLQNGHTEKFAHDVPEFSLENMRKLLNSNQHIGYGYLEFIGEVLRKDIYILDADKEDVYRSDEFAQSLRGNRNSIVLYYIPEPVNHYELVGVRHSDKEFVTNFSPNNSFIKFLRQRIL